MSPSTVSIYCVNLGEEVAVRGDSTLLEVARSLRSRLGFEPVAARVNNKNEALCYRIYRPRTVDFLPVTSPSGERTAIRSLCMMLYLAVERLYPGTRLSIEHSISRGYYCRLKGGVEVTADTVEALSQEMQRIVEADLPFERCEDLTPRVIDIFRRQGLDDKVRLLETIHEPYTVYYRLDGLCDSYYGVLAPSTGMLGAFRLQPFEEGFLLYGPDRTDPVRTPDYVEQKKMYKAFTDYVDFNFTVGVHNVGGLNERIAAGGGADLVNVAEALHEKALARISDAITARYRRGEARIVLIAGPSSSGKTTTTKRLAVQLMTNLLKPQLISLDDYFVDRTRTPRDASGDYDYESLHALDLPQFNADLADILAGREVALPTYDFATGTRSYLGNTVKLGEGSILLIEGIHGLNPELTGDIPEDQKFRLYVSALTTITIDDHNWIPTTDNRLLRRIIRDHKYRGIGALDTIRRWPSVRRGEERWIFPYQENADATFNSSLLFELSTMKEYADSILGKVPRDVPEYAEAYRLMKFLSYFAPLPLSAVPSTSVIREFLGGSSFKY